MVTLLPSSCCIVWVRLIGYSLSLLTIGEDDCCKPGATDEVFVSTQVTISYMTLISFIHVPTSFLLLSRGFSNWKDETVEFYLRLVSHKIDLLFLKVSS